MCSDPRDAGECVWQLSEPWVGAIASLAEDPGVLLNELRDWAALLDRHSLVHVKARGSDTEVSWCNVPGTPASARECAVRLGALRALLGYACTPRSLPRVEHTECLVRGDEDCVFTVEGVSAWADPLHERALREAYLLAHKLQGHESRMRRLSQFSPLLAPFPDVRGLRAVRRFMEEVEDIILIFDANLWILDANRAAVRFAGMTLNELRGLHAADLMTQESFEIVQRTLPKLMEKGALSGLQIQGRRRDGEVPLEVSARVAENGQSMVCIARDVSRHLYLEQELEARNQLLQAQNNRISEATRLKSEFLANVSHELTTPLTCIRGFAKLLRGDIEGELGGGLARLPSEKRLEVVRILESESQRMGQLIGGLLELSKIESGVVRLDRVKLSLNSIVEESVMVMKPRLDELGMRVQVQLDPCLPKALLDFDRMKQVVLNLLDNAIKFSPEGSELLLGTLGGEGAMRLTLRNPASGLREEDLTRIFERFVQRDGSYTRQRGGVGLGLDLVRAIVELHGGRVWAELREPDLVEFSVELPV